MTTYTNAELIAEARERGSFAMTADDQDLVDRLAERLEAADQRAEEAERERDNWKMSAEEAERAEKRLAAVVEKVRSAIERESGWFRYRAERVSDILATAPANVLRELKADVWEEGSETGFTHGMTYQAGNNSAMNYRNPYRQAKRVLMTHPHDGHGLGDTCLDCQRREEKG